MQVISTPLSGVLVLEPRVHGDERGFFFESWNQRTLDEAVGRSVTFVQDNHSRSEKGVVRGLHYQLPSPQAKLVRCTAGAVWDVVVDLRRGSPTFTEWFGLELSEENKRQLWIPEGFGHGFVSLSHVADVLYKATDYYVAESERAIAWDDPEIGIEWPTDVAPILSSKDSGAAKLAQSVTFD